MRRNIGILPEVNRPLLSGNKLSPSNDMNLLPLLPLSVLGGRGGFPLKEGGVFFFFFLVGWDLLVRGCFFFLREAALCVFFFFFLFFLGVRIVCHWPLE